MGSTQLSAEQRTSRRRKITAVLAGGMVLGVGAAVTLAAWNDSEFAIGSFGAGSFNIEGSTTSATAGYAEHEDEAGAAVVFDVEDYGNLAPEDVVYEPFWVRLDADSTSNATLSLEGVSLTTGANADNLAYNVYNIAADATCGAAAVAGAPVVGSGATLALATVGTSADLAIGAGADAGAPVQLCFQVTAAGTLEQGETASTTWEFEAISVD